MPPQVTATACMSAAFAARMSKGESPTYAQSFRSTFRRLAARMIAPESITVPSRSKSTTGKSMELMLARRGANPDRPGLDALDDQDRLHPGVAGEAPADFCLVLRVEDQQSRSEIRIADRPAE